MGGGGWGGHGVSFGWVCAVGAAEAVLEVEDGARTSSSTRSALRAIAAADPAPAAVMTWARGSTTFPRPRPRGRWCGRSASVVTHPSVVRPPQPRPVSRSSFGTKRGRHEQRVPGHDAAVVQLHAAEPVVVDDELLDGALHDADRAGQQLGPLGGGEEVGRGEVDEVVGPLSHDLGVTDGARCAADDSEPAVPHLVAVAVGTVEDVAGPAVAQPGDVRELVAQPGRDQDPSCRDLLPVGQSTLNRRRRPARGRWRCRRRSRRRSPRPLRP